MNLTFTTPGGKRLESKKLKWTTRLMDRNMDRGLIAAAIEYEGDVKEKYLRGQSLNVRTEKLIQSITHDRPRTSPAGRYIKVGTNVKYASIHEHGGTIRAENAPYLHFKTTDGNWVRTKEVHIPKRPYMEPALDKARAKLLKIIQRHVTKPIRRG